MERADKWGGRCLAGAMAVLGLVLGMAGLVLLLQTGWSHREARFVPTEPRAELTALLEAPRRTQADDALLFRQTGLSPTAVEELLEQGETGKEKILQAQEGFYTAPAPQCISLIGGRFTCEDRLRNEKGKPVYGVPLAPLHPGDLLVSFSTHTLGWRHGHAGLVLDAGHVLEAVQLGTNSRIKKVDHWRTYSNFLVLRVKDAAARMGQAVADYARQVLNNVPYSLLPGILTPKDGPVEEGPGIHCAYLPWYAWNQQGVDLDADGGPIVTVGDLARSPQLEVVQVFGLDPALVADRQSGAAEHA